MNAQTIAKAETLEARHISLSPFSGLQTFHKGNLYWLPSEDSGVTFDAGISKDYIHISTDPEKLILHTGNYAGPAAVPKLLLSGPALNYLELNGNGSFITLKPIHTSDLWVDIRGAGDLQIEVHTQSLRIRMFGSGNAVIKGKTNLFDLKIYSSGDVRAKDLQSVRILAETEGSGKTEIKAEEYLRLNLRGSGDVTLYSCPLTDVNITGSGQLVYRLENEFK